MTTNSIAGVWKLKKYTRRFLDTGEVRSDMLPQAYILYTPGGYMMSITVEENRQSPADEVLTDAERVRLFKSIISAYSGSYTVEGDKVIHDVELSWNEAWTGTKQVPVTSPEAEAMSKALKNRGFKFVGPVIVYAFMQATGMVNDHLEGCFRHGPVRAMAR